MCLYLGTDLEVRVENVKRTRDLKGGGAEIQGLGERSSHGSVYDKKEKGVG